jgi:hypothetical protein
MNNGGQARVAICPGLPLQLGLLLGLAASPPSLPVGGSLRALGANACMLGLQILFHLVALSNMFLHSARSASHFTLLWAERSIHLVQTLPLTRLGAGDPCWAQAGMAGGGSHWSEDSLGD